MPTTNMNTIRFHRVLRADPERIYRAFLDADAMAKWLPPNGFTGKVHHLDARVGGRTEPLLRREVPRAGPERAHPLHGQVRRREPAGGDAGHHQLEEGLG